MQDESEDSRAGPSLIIRVAEWKNKIKVNIVTCFSLLVQLRATQKLILYLPLLFPSAEPRPANNQQNGRTFGHTANGSLKKGKPNILYPNSIKF